MANVDPVLNNELALTTSESVLYETSGIEAVDLYSTAVLKLARLQLSQAIEVIEALVGFDPVHATTAGTERALRSAAGDADLDWEVACALDAVELYRRLEDCRVIEYRNNLDQHVLTVGPDISGFDYLGLQGDPSREFDGPASDVFNCANRLFLRVADLYRDVGRDNQP